MNDDAMLRNHRRAFLWSLLLLVVGGVALFLVGRHPPELRPLTSVPAIGRFDASMLTWMDDIRTQPVTWLARLLSIIGAGVVTIPLRARRHDRLGGAPAVPSCERLRPHVDHRRDPDRGPEELVPPWASAREDSWRRSAIRSRRATRSLPRRRPWPSSWPSSRPATGAGAGSGSPSASPSSWRSPASTWPLTGSPTSSSARSSESGIAIFWAAAVTEMRDLMFRSEGKPIPPDAAEAAPEELLHR